MDKVRLPREVAEAIEGLRSLGYGPYAIVCMVHEKRNEPGIDVIRRYAPLHHGELMQALVNGYEVEYTPEDRVRNYHKELLECIEKNPTMERAQCEWRSEVEGIEKTLDFLNIKIEGINS